MFLTIAIVEILRFTHSIKDNFVGAKIAARASSDKNQQITHVTNCFGTTYEYGFI